MKITDREVAPASVEAADREPRVQSVARAISILGAVGQSPSGLKASEIAAVAELPKQATYHLVHTLVTTGMLTRNDRGYYVLGLRVGTLAEAFRRQLAPPEHLAPIVRRISLETGEASYASGWWTGEIVTLAASAGSGPVQATEVPLGTFSDAHARASGKLLLAFASDDVRDRYFSSHALTRRTRSTIISLSKLADEFARIREQRYAIDNEEYSTGLCCLAIPIEQGSPFALTLSAPVERFRENFHSYLNAVTKIAQSVSGGRRIYKYKRPEKSIQRASQRSASPQEKSGTPKSARRNT